jgi:hypothetical protein
MLQKKCCRGVCRSVFLDFQLISSPLTHSGVKSKKPILPIPHVLHAISN